MAESGKASGGDGPSINTEVASLVGHVTIDTKDANGKPVTLLLDNFGFDDWSAVQERFLKRKKASLVTVAVDAGKAIVEAADPDEKSQAEAERMAKTLREEALTLAARSSGITQDDFVEMISSPAGSAMFLWVMIERRYPGKYAVSDVERMIREDAITDEIVGDILESLKTAMGMAGNSQGQGK